VECDILADDSATEIDQIKKEIEKESKEKTKSEKQEFDFKITINKISLTMFLLFGAVLLYLVSSIFAELPPFSRDYITGDLFIEYEFLLTSLLVIGLLFLGFGFYFLWFHKETKEQEKEEIEELEDFLTENSELDTELAELENRQKK
jgi:hypothetical protein